MKRLRWPWILVLFLLVSACRTAPPPSAGDLDTAAMDTASQVWFLPPIGKGVAVTGNFDGNLNLEIQIFNVHPIMEVASGDALGPTLSMTNGGISVGSKHYQANWSVPATTANSDASEYLRVEVRASGAPVGPACNDDPNATCLGYFDVRLVINKGQSGTPPGFIEVGRNETLPIKFFVAEQVVGAPPSTLAELVTVSGQQAFDEELGNCSTNEFDTPGQKLSITGAKLSITGAKLSITGAKLSITGAIGGLLIFEPTSNGTPEGELLEIAPPGEVAEQLLGIEGLSNPFQEAAMIVADDFGGFYKLPDNLFDSSGEINLSVLEQLEEDGELTHGRVVFDHMLRLVAGAGYAQVGEGLVSGEPFVEFKKGGSGPSLHVQAVDTAGFNTEVIAQNIQSKVAELKQAGYHRIVVNMSFVVIPCAVEDDYAASSSSIGAIETLEDYVEKLAEVNGINPQFLGDLLELITTPLKLFQDEPLFEYLDNPGPGVVNVASAGNFGNAFPFYPAAEPKVIGISSQNILEVGFSPQKSWFSNSGEVMLPGALYMLGSQGNKTIAYAGTSFSAPVAALFTALDLTQYEPRCDPGGLVNGTFMPPALAHNDVNFYNLPLDGMFGNAGSAVAKYCKLPQTISFALLEGKFYGHAPFPLSATASSGLTVSFELGQNSTACSLDGATVTITGLGSCTITASQAGNDDYAAANPVTQSFNVSYNFDGFFSPVSNDERNVVKAGQVVPLKWQITDANGDPITNLTSVSLTVEDLPCSLGSTENQLSESATGGSGLQNQGGGYYQLNWTTLKSYANSCKRLQLDLGEGFFRTAEFKFTR